MSVFGRPPNGFGGLAAGLSILDEFVTRRLPCVHTTIEFQDVGVAEGGL
jgi:hypothetical protein